MGALGSAGMDGPTLASVLEQVRAKTQGPLLVNILMPFLDIDAVKVAAKGAQCVDFYHGEPDASLVELVHAEGAVAGGRSGQPRTPSKPRERDATSWSCAASRAAAACTARSHSGRCCSQIFTVFGQPDVRVQRQKDGTYLVELRGVDIYDPLTGEVHSTRGEDVAAWFLDTDYDGKTFHICQAISVKPSSPATQTPGRNSSGP